MTSPFPFSSHCFPCAILFITLVSATGCSTDEPPGPLSDVPGDLGAEELPGDGGPEAEITEPTPLGDATLDESDLGELAITGLVAIENPANALSFFVEWSTTLGVQTTLDVSCTEDVQLTFHDEDSVIDHSVFVMGLLEGVSCTMTATAMHRELTAEASVTVDEVGPLPDSIPALDMRVLDAARVQPGWTLWNINSSAQVGPIIVALVDEHGRYRWYHLHGDSAVPAAGNDTRVVAGGILMGGRSPFPPAAWISWSGEVLWEASFTNHHAIRPSPWDEDFLLYLSHTTDCPEETREGTVNEFDFLGQETTWTWSLCDHYVPENIVPDWSHINAAVPFPGERALLLSVRDQDMIIRVDRDTDELVWTLGEGRDFEMDAEDVFLRQHAPEFQDNGNILLFDNGRDGLREYSRVIELELSFDAEGEPLRAEVVWDYTDEDLYARVKSDADRLANGNTLITYGGLEDPFESLLLEVTTEGEVVWELRTPPEWSTYRSHRVEPYYGQVSQPSPDSP